IFEMQLSAIRHGLGATHTLDFVEGAIPAKMDDDFKHLINEDEKCFSYFDEDDLSSSWNALKHLDGFFNANGPYDGIIAFSQPVGLVGTWILDRIARGIPSVKCGIFLSAASTAVDPASLQRGRRIDLRASTAPQQIDIPTAHIYGENDPYKNEAQEFAAICNEDSRFVLIHPGGHEVPGSGSNSDVKDSIQLAINVIQRAILLGS
ncbi:hypothetical protein FSARC_6645, partial [Fusarium sarcochroum]